MTVSATLYILTKKVARVISIPLMLHNSVASPLPRAKQRDPVGHKYDNAVPEVSLLATVIVVLKMVYGLDGRARYRNSLTPLRITLSIQTVSL